LEEIGSFWKYLWKWHIKKESDRDLHDVLSVTNRRLTIAKPSLNYQKNRTWSPQETYPNCGYFLHGRRNTWWYKEKWLSLQTVFNTKEMANEKFFLNAW